jgi:adenylylsulfate kinase
MKRETKSRNIFWTEGVVGRPDREQSNGHRGVTLWLTGLSASGKSTLARALEGALFARGCQVLVLDGDNIRHGLNRDLGFSPDDRAENIRRIGEVARLFAEFGAIAITAFISPYRSDRDGVRALSRADDFIEVHVDCDLATCEARDPKGLYAKARRGEIAEFTGISAPYEAPERPELVVRTDQFSERECVEQLIEYLEANGYLGRRAAEVPASM